MARSSDGPNSTWGNSAQPAADLDFTGDFSCNSPQMTLALAASVSQACSRQLFFAGRAAPTKD